MSRKNAINDTTVPCTCNLCGQQAHAVKGKKHRRCGGAPMLAVIRPKHDMIPKANRGTWE